MFLTKARELWQKRKSIAGVGTDNGKVASVKGQHLRGIKRIFGVVPKTLLRWIKTALKKLPTIAETLAPARRRNPTPPP